MAEFITEGRSMEQRYTEAMQMAGYDPVEPQENSLATVFFQNRATKEITGWDGWESVGVFLEEQGVEQQIQSLDFWKLVNQGHFSRFEREDFTSYKIMTPFQFDIMLQLVPPETLKLDGYLFQDMDFCNRDLKQGTFTHCRFHKCRFQPHTLQNLDFSGSLFAGCDWNGVQIRQCSFEEAQISCCTFSDCTIQQSDFTSTGFLDTGMTDCILEGNQLKNAVSRETGGPYRLLADLQDLQKTGQKQAENKKKTVCMRKSR